MAPDTPKEATYNGIAASPGIAHGPVFLLSQKELAIPKFRISPEQRDAEVQRFEDALLVTRGEIQRIQDEIRGSLGEDEARIFDAHLLVLEDQALIGESIREMDESSENIESAVWSVGQKYIAAFDQIDDEYLKERASDIRDVLRRVLANLTGEKMNRLGTFSDGRVLVAHDITPSESAGFDRKNLLGIVTDAGSKTSHAVIMARSMNLPAVVGLGNFAENISHDDVVLVDGYDGVVIVNPSEATLFRYGQLKIERKSVEDRLLEMSKNASRTLDGHEVQLMANIETSVEATRSIEFGADGIGLFRTEYLFMNMSEIPSEEDQFLAYKEVAEIMAGKPVVIRTLDLGGDKIVAAAEMPLIKEANPFLGYRAIRFCLDHEKLFKEQLRAILRASEFGDVRLMYPMISGLGELRQANELLESCKSELSDEGIAFDRSLMAGTMIEIPSAALAADTLVGDSKFFSIGTNDLIQYTIAVDRLNDRVAHLYEPTHPAIIRLMNMVIEAARQGNLPVGVCGEVAGDPVMVPLLIGLGVSSLSMSPGLLPSAKFVVQNMDMDDARSLARMAREETDPIVILEHLVEYYTSKTSELF